MFCLGVKKVSERGAYPSLTLDMGGSRAPWGDPGRGEEYKNTYTSGNLREPREQQEEPKGT